MKGHIRQRSKGSWTIWVDLGRDPETGKRKQQTLTVRGGKKDAERELRAILTRIEGGTYVRPIKITVGEYLETWLRDYVSTNTAPSTADGYSDIVKAHIIPELGQFPLTALQPSHIQAYYSRMLGSGRRDGKGGLSAQTVKHHHRVLYEALKHAVKHGVLIRNVVEAVDPPRPQNREMSTLEPDDVHSLLNAARGTPHYTLFYTAVYTGLRRSELLGLRWRDVDLDLSTLSVVQTLHHISKKGYTFREPKTRRSRRLVDLSPSLAVLLREHRANQELERELLGRQLMSDDLVFSYSDGTPLPPNSVTKAFHKLVQSLGLSGIRLHDLRHTHATLMLRQGVHPKVVSERLGHSSVAITLDTYSHVLPGIQAAAARRFDEGLQRTTEKVSEEKVG
jgi:integrase